MKNNSEKTNKCRICGTVYTLEPDDCIAYSICPICGWEDEPDVEEYEESDANHMSPHQAKIKYFSQKIREEKIKAEELRK